MSQKEPSQASKNQNPAFTKTLKTHWFLKVLGYRGLSREPQEAQEGSQKAPKEIQDHKKGTQNWTQKLKKNDGFLRFLKRLFEAPDGPLGLILAASWADLAPKFVPKRISKVDQNVIKKWIKL